MQSINFFKEGERYRLSYITISYYISYYINCAHMLTHTRTIVYERKRIYKRQRISIYDKNIDSKRTIEAIKAIAKERYPASHEAEGRASKYICADQN
jgi:hypothetical protein